MTLDPQTMLDFKEQEIILLKKALSQTVREKQELQDCHITTKNMLEGTTEMLMEKMALLKAKELEIDFLWCELKKWRQVVGN